MELIMGKNLPHGQLDVQRFPKNVIQITFHHVSFADVWQRSGKSGGPVHDT
jgi:hypothetical protein